MMEIFSFELKYRLKRPATWIYMALGMAIALLISILHQITPSLHSTVTASATYRCRGIGQRESFGLLVATMRGG